MTNWSLGMALHENHNNHTCCVASRGSGTVAAACAKRAPCADANTESSAVFTSRLSLSQTNMSRHIVVPSKPPNKQTSVVPATQVHQWSQLIKRSGQNHCTVSSTIIMALNLQYLYVSHDYSQHRTAQFTKAIWNVPVALCSAAAEWAHLEWPLSLRATHLIVLLSKTLMSLKTLCTYNNLWSIRNFMKMPMAHNCM